MTRNILKITAFLFIPEIVLIAGLMLTSMGDDRPMAIGGYFYKVLKYIFGFPMVLLNPNYPFFLDHGGSLMASLCLTTLNNLILAAAIWGLVSFIRKMLNAPK